MARPIETGIGYFPMDTGIFSDRKIRKLLKTFDAKGYLIYTFVLCEIYKDKGYFVKCDSDFLFDISDRLNQTEALVKEVIKFCVSNGLFDKRVFDVESILTSSGIQKRYFKIKERSSISINEKYIIATETGVIATETGVIDAETTKLETETTLKKSKVKKSKVKKSKGREFVPPPLDEVKEFFKSEGYLELLAIKMFNFYSVANWVDSKGKPVKNWKQKAIMVWFKDEYKMPSGLGKQFSKDELFG